MADQIRFTPVQVFDANGAPVSGAKAYFYQTGTTTPLTVYSDEALTTAHASPLVADSEGVFPAVFFNGSTSVKVDVTDADDVRLDGYPIDPATLHSGGRGASTISFSATAENPNTNVQDAVAHASEIVNDTTPQLGGDLDANGNSIRFDGGTGLTDDAGNEVLTVGKTTSAVNEVKVSNAATGSGPLIEATGDDTNIDLKLAGKGTGKVAVDDFEATGAITETVYVLSGTDIDPANGTIQTKTLSANATLTESIASGQSVVLQIDDGAGPYTITWPTITWVSGGGSAPNLTLAATTVIILWKVSTTLYGARVG